MENQNSTPAQPTVDSGSGIEMATLQKLMEASKTENLNKLKKEVNLSSTYVELEKVGDSFRGIYIGLTKINLTDEDSGEVRELDAARFLIDGKIRLNAGSVLISELKQTQVPTGTPLQVTYTEKKGRTKIYSLTLIG